MSLRLIHYSDLENAYDDPTRAARVAGLVERVRADAGPDPIVLGSGDDTAPGVLSLTYEGRQSLDLYRTLDPDVETFGNHDFDYGLDTAREIVAESPQAWVSSNVFLDGRPFGEGVGVEPWTIVERGGDRVGVFGVLDDATPALNPTAEPLDVTDPVEAAREATGALRDRGVDAVVALSHLGTGDRELAAAVDVDAVLGGHVPSERIERIDGTTLTRPGSGGQVLLELDLTDGAVNRHEVDDAPPDGSVQSRLDERLSDAGLDEVVGYVEEPIERTESAVFRGESRIGNFVADAYRWAAGADVGLQNSGGVRAGPPLIDAVTVADLVSVVPFQEPVSVAELSGTELLAVLRGAVESDLKFAEPDWWHAHVSGARLVWDRNEHSLVDVTVGGDPVDPDATYSLATTDYLFFSADEFPALDERHRVRRLDTQYEVLADYARERGIDPIRSGRIVRSAGSDY
ncbi:bifunctional metallophosphatase/5'-nucleotidase [Halanaeroarchaeum sulfurireducens]|uniref:5'-nucleotidase n=1 Tax=Halanaeroarchaeum sulfurireducens TaxID=1604004 RepID=A0A0F7PB29_9EURY|nr:5'-nucleotidase C-terminal domain-containing protein [Halanaeroarchaeum sulfurireducens]AKH97922.1 5'-nucleotidase [Halanaeroarchaeum sulfurireducens]ALG82316.1 5'-nucleotidase [Halanaeroarchaeum sulfurireducens]